MIEARDISFRYGAGSHTVLNRVNVTIREHDFIAVLGPSGSGKSTLCLTLNGIIPQSIPGTLTGEITVDGLSTAHHQVYELADKVGIVLQNPESQLFAMSIEEELAFGPENLGLPREEIQERIEEVLSLIGIPDRNRFPFSLSGGEKQRLAIASMLTMRPSYLVLDEPTSQLDPRGKEEVFSMLCGLHAQGMAIVLIEHDTEHVATHAHSVVVLKNGRVLMSGSPKKIFSDVQKMKALGIQVPEVAEFTYELHQRGLIDDVCITLEEALNNASLSRICAALPPREEHISSLSQSEEEPPLIDIRNLSFKYEDTPVLTDISLRIREGEIVAVVGQNGSGKTTLVKHFNGLLRPCSGDIYIDGNQVSEKSVAEMARTVGYVFQNPNHQIFADTVFDEVEFGLINLGVPQSERTQQIYHVLKETGLYRYKDHHPTSLSGGEKQRLAIASVLVMNPKILILDEPTTGLDLKSSRSIIELVKTLHSQNRTVILITHDMRLVAEMAQRIIILKQGKIVADSTTREIFSDEALLHDNYLEAPQITRLSRLLGCGVCLSVPELLQKVGVDIEREEKENEIKIKLKKEKEREKEKKRGVNNP
ncbi:MAG: energy-coupling factor ABC transporter ATP-binding protein [Theionarchaea archaeon]|nr:energy-coupling factor ABC transporter ATP-binding protein [Theionarchaea archaeon]